MPTLTIADETAPGSAGSPGTAGRISREMTLDFLTEKVTVRELIRSRVYQEVQDYNLRRPEHFQGLVQPADTEKTLNGYKLKRGREIDWKQQYDKALDAFGRNGFLILVDNKQAESFDDEVTITPETRVTFLKLVPLVGG